MVRVSDQMGFELEVPSPPKRIVSLVPSQTELLAYLGLEKQVVGITRFCTEPESWFKQKARIGGTKDLHIEKILALAPDLVLGNKEENEKAAIEALKKEVPVWLSDVRDLDSALAMIGQVSKMCGKGQEGLVLQKEIQAAFAELKPLSRPKKVAYFIWRKPWMLVGGDTFIDAMLERLGFENVGRQFSGRYPSLSEAELSSLDADWYFLSSEPYPFGTKHREELETLVQPGGKSWLVDGALFSWYGSRLLQSPGYFSSLLAQLEQAKA